MDCLMVSNKKNGLLSILIAILALFAGVSSSEAGYRYQTHQTQHSPTAARSNHVSVKLGDGRVGISRAPAGPMPSCLTRTGNNLPRAV